MVFVIEPSVVNVFDSFLSKSSKESKPNVIVAPSRVLRDGRDICDTGGGGGGAADLKLELLLLLLLGILCRCLF